MVGYLATEFITCPVCANTLVLSWPKENCWGLKCTCFKWQVSIACQCMLLWHESCHPMIAYLLQVHPDSFLFTSVQQAGIPGSLLYSLLMHLMTGWGSCSGKKRKKAKTSLPPPWLTGKYLFSSFRSPWKDPMEVSTSIVAFSFTFPVSRALLDFWPTQALSSLCLLIDNEFFYYLCK